MNTITKPFNVGDETNYINAITELRQELSKVSKNISYLDIYNIIDVVEDKNDLSAKMSSLTNNSSLVINTEPFDLLGTTYNTGDIILKLASGKTIHIKAQAAGLFYPSELASDENGNYTLIYNYSSVAPLDQRIKQTKYDKPYTTMSFTVEGSSEQVSIYGIWAPMIEIKNENQTITQMEYFIDQYEINGATVQPQIQFWVCDEEGNSVEQIYIDFLMLPENNKWHIKTEPMPRLWIKVK